MRKALMLLLTLLMVASMPIRVKAAPTPNEQSVVHAVLFWSNGCPYCNQVLTTTLPPLQDQYQSQLSLLLIEVVTLEDVENLYSLGASLGLTKEQVATPFLVIDRIALVGADEIESKLSGLIDKYLTSGGLDYPDLSVLNEMLSSGIVFTSFDPYLHLVPQKATSTNSTGIALAWGVMVIMAIALILAIMMILRAFQGKPLREIKGWLDIAIPVLAIVGLGASIYLTYIEVTHSRALCGPVGDCNAVQSSPYAKLFGVLPISLLGAIGYIAILVTWFWRRFRTDALSKIAGPVMYAMALFGTLFSIYLTYLELFVIHAVCIWCLSSAVIITALMLLSLPPLTQWLASSDEEE
jgi:uncharacterized membrane protein/glutaredoxin